MTNVQGIGTTFEYNKFGYRTATTDQSGARTVFTYDDVGNILTATDQGGNTRVFEYDALNRVTSATDPNGGRTTFDYDVLGNLTRTTDPMGNSTTYSYDWAGRLIRTRNPLGGIELRTYDVSGNMVSYTNPDNEVTSFTYNAGDQLLFEDRSDGERVSYEYDGLGHLTHLAYADSDIRFDYDKVGNLLRQTTNGSAGVPSSTVDYAYDQAGRNLTTSFVGYGSQRYDYDKYGLMSSIVTDGAKKYEFTNNAMQHLTTVRLPNGVSREFDYDSRGQITKVSNRGPTGLISEFTYSYDVEGNPANVLAARSNAAFTPSLNYTFDKVGNLTSASPTLVGGVGETYSYDRAGNRIRRQGSTEDHKIDAANRLLDDGETTFQYDQSGRLRQSVDKESGLITDLIYNGGDQLIRIEQRASAADLPTIVASYRYDGLGRRVERTVDGITRRYVYDSEDIALELDENNNLLARYVHGPGLDRPLAMEQGPQSLYYLTDSLGSTTELVDASGAITQQIAYDSFGNVLRQTRDDIRQPYYFTGREYDSGINLYYMRYRFYDSQVGRFISADPLGIASQTTNFYTYGGNNPTRFTDAFGLMPGNPEYCRRLLEQIENIQKEIDKRIGELHEDPLGLPETCPGDKAKPSLSKEGHRRLLNEHKANLARRKAEYLVFCNDEPPNGSPVPSEDWFDRKYWEKVTGLTGTALIIYLIISEGSRLFPPRNLVPVP